ncbi:hypothetical protein AX14_003634 [Amanita brunnescens Koide BX004]|nr:hypothetical protein AX14_003634 [Amanita brunnescens Koide BX004]
MPIPLSASTLQTLGHASNETILTPTAIRHEPVVAVSEDKATGAKECLPIAKVTPTLPGRSPALPMQAAALPMQAAALRQPLDEASPIIGVAPRQHDLCIVNMEPLAGDTHSSKTEAARKQSEPVKTPSVEGQGRYLSRAAAYIRERMSRRTRVHVCDTFVPQAQREPPDKLVEPETRRQGQEIVRTNTTSTIGRSLCAIATLTPLISMTNSPSAAISKIMRSDEV